MGVQPRRLPILNPTSCSIPNSNTDSSLSLTPWLYYGSNSSLAGFGYCSNSFLVGINFFLMKDLDVFGAPLMCFQLWFVGLSVTSLIQGLSMVTLPCLNNFSFESRCETGQLQFVVVKVLIFGVLCYLHHTSLRKLFLPDSLFIFNYIFCRYFEYVLFFGLVLIIDGLFVILWCFYGWVIIFLEFIFISYYIYIVFFIVKIVGQILPFMASLD